MSEITRLKPKPKNPDRLDLYLDGEYHCSIDSLVAAKHTLYVGKEIDCAVLDKIVLESDRRRAFDKALDYLSRYPSTVKGVTGKLYDWGFGRAVVEPTIEKLKEYGYLDDAEYARAYVAVNGRVKGERRLESELKSKGVSAELIATALDGFDGFGKALELARRHSRGKDLEDRNYLAKLGNYLLYRGYGWEDVARCVAALKKERKDE